jgi:ATP-dependent helicase HrpA
LSSMSLESRLYTIRRRIPQAMLREQEQVARHVGNIEKKLRHEDRVEKALEGEAASLERRLGRSIRERESRQARRPDVTYPEMLPITAAKDDIIRAIKENQVIIVSGDTGSGKSTQLPKMCLEAGRGIAGKIGCTQPRRIGAGTIARRIAEELGENLGESVGYKVRFRDRTPRSAYIKILTDGMLLAETQRDRRLYQYDTLIIDEAHERTINIDFLLGILKTLLGTRPELKLIISSATLDTEKFSQFFDGAPIIQVSGRMYPVEVLYLPSERAGREEDELPYVDTVVKAVDKIMKEMGRGDILIFMPTEQDILETCEKLEGRQYRNTAILPLFARLSWSQQKKVYKVEGYKIVVATNVAETSLTIPGIRYVIDTGLARISRYMPGTRTTALPISTISRASADQRKGRCGRVQNGVCIRLYEEEDFLARPEFTLPEIMRSNLAEVTLRMIALKLGDITEFPFLDRPGQRSITDGFNLLTELGAVSGKGREVELTKRGRLMAGMPLDPRISRMMIEARLRDCVDEVAVIAAALSIKDPRERPTEKAKLADQAHAPFKDVASDFITILNIWNQYGRTSEGFKSGNKMRAFCREHFLSFPRMREWVHVHDQIRSIMDEQKEWKMDPNGQEEKEGLFDRIHKSILAGFLSNIAVKKEKNMYQAARGREVMVFPGSTLFNKGAPWIVAAEIIKTSRLFARTVAKIDPNWLEELGGGLCRSTYSHPHWEKTRGEVRALEQVTLFGLVIVSARSVSFGRIDPEQAHRIFIQSALVEGDVKETLGFLKENRELFKRVQEVEEKVRRRGILISEEAVADFYSARLQGVFDIRSLKHKIRERGEDDFLRMKESDLLLERPESDELALFPNQVGFGNRVFDCSYKFAPGREEDGVTVSVPSGLLPLVSPEKLEWSVPGLYREKITSLVKGLPKRYRKLLVPVSNTVDVIEKEMEQRDGSLVSALSAFVFDRFGVDIPASVWAAVEIPEYLKMRISIIDHRGHELEAGRNLHLLSRSVPEVEPADTNHAWKKAREKWEREGITGWDLGDLPESVPVGPSTAAYPGLEPREKCVNIRLFTTPQKALASHKEGVRQLFMLHFSRDLRFLKQDLSLKGTECPGASYFGGATGVEKAMYECLLRMLFQKNIRTREAFGEHALGVRNSMPAKAWELRDQALKVLDAYHETRLTLQRIENGSRENKSVLELCALVREELRALVPENFLEIYTLDRLAQFPRYLKALEMRIERGAYDPLKDRKRADEAEAFSDELERMNQDAVVSGSSTEKREALEDLRWMIEEFKVSLFAQELKTAFPVSSKRLKKKIDEIKRMV